MIDARNGWAWAKRDENGWAWSRGDEFSTLLLHTSDSGRTWQDRTPRAFPYTTRICCFPDSQTVLATTDGILDGIPGPSGILRTTNGGISWVWIRMAAIAKMEDFNFFNASHGVFREEDGGMGSLYVRFYETQDGGANWLEVPIVLLVPILMRMSSRP